MQYEVSKLGKNNISLNKNQIFPVMGLYCFVLGTSLLGFSVYLFLESSGFVEQVFYQLERTRSFLVLYHFFYFFVCSIYTGRIFSEYFIENRSFKNLLTNIVSVIFVSLFFLIVFKFCLEIKMCS